MPAYLSGRSGLCLSSCHECLQSKALKISRGVVSSTAHDIGNSGQNLQQSPGKFLNKALRALQLQNSTTAGCHPPRTHLNTHSAFVWAQALASISVQLWKCRALFSSGTDHLESHLNKSWWARKWAVLKYVLSWSKSPLNWLFFFFSKNWTLWLRNAAGSVHTTIRTRLTRAASTSTAWRRCK